MHYIVEVKQRHFVVKRRDTREEVFEGDIREVEDYLDVAEEQARQRRRKEDRVQST